MSEFSDLEGRTFPAFTYTIERNKLREFLLAIGDDNPDFLTDGASLPPTFPTVVSFWGGFGITEVMEDIGVQMQNVLHADQEYQYLASIKVGDTLTGSTVVKSVRARAGMDFIGLETEYTNQEGTPVLLETSTIIVRGDDA